MILAMTSFSTDLTICVLPSGRRTRYSPVTTFPSDASLCPKWFAVKSSSTLSWKQTIKFCKLQLRFIKDRNIDDYFLILGAYFSAITIYVAILDYNSSWLIILSLIQMIAMYVLSLENFGNTLFISDLTEMHTKQILLKDSFAIAIFFPFTYYIDSFFNPRL